MIEPAAPDQLARPEPRLLDAVERDLRHDQSVQIEDIDFRTEPVRRILLPDVEQRRKDAAQAFPALVAGLPLGGKARPRYRALLHPPVPPAIRRSFAVPPSTASIPAPPVRYSGRRGQRYERQRSYTSRGGK